MPDVTATDAARNFADLLDAVEHRGERFTIIRRGHVVAHLEPTSRGAGRVAKELLARHAPDRDWRADLDEMRALTELEDRQ